MTAPVADRLRELEAEIARVKQKPCVCGHPYSEHWNGRCWHPLVRVLSDDRPCRCRLFTDPTQGEG
jgi:uncharacterized protein with PIN domain